MFKNPYRFIKVEEFFNDYQSWECLHDVISCALDNQQKIAKLEFNKSDGESCSLLIQFVLKNSFRVKFNPHNYDLTQHTEALLVRDWNNADLRLALEEENPFEVNFTQLENSLIADVLSLSAPVMRVVIGFTPFSIRVINTEDPTEEFDVWQTSAPGIYYKFDGFNDYSIIQSVKKPPLARYAGFGEQGGQAFGRGNVQLTYFNYDNMRYRQVYNRGPRDPREPMYHSDPFFIEFNADRPRDCSIGMYIDNASQVCIDMGYLHSHRYLLGTRFGDLEYYFFMGGSSLDTNVSCSSSSVEVAKSFTTIFGRPNLKPRYALGYHQGCYGYENRADLEWVVNKHRDYQIPLDGLHIDVDFQKNYQTFTIDTERFPDPKGMFAYLRTLGIKCSTNITPIISNLDLSYTTYIEGIDNNYFVKDVRYDPNNSFHRSYQDFDAGTELSRYYDGSDYNSGNPFIGEVYYGDYNAKPLGTTGHYPDLGRSEVREWWGKQYQYLFDMGLEFVWQDMTTPAIRPTRGDMRGFPFTLMVTDNFDDNNIKLNQAIRIWNLYSYNLHRATFDGLNNLSGREGKRNFIIGRGSFSGSHRYTALWTGDNSSTWDFLRISIVQTLSLGLTGMSVNGQDIGGFESATDDEHWADPELLIRWTAVGAFLPWFRNHYIRKGKKYFQEPFMYFEWFNNNSNGILPEPAQHYQSVLPACRYYIQLRYRLLQLFYDAMFEGTVNGLPICRSMFLHANQDSTLYAANIKFLSSQFFVRSDLLVAPLLEPQSYDNGNGKRDVYLPYGADWYSFTYNERPIGKKIEGGLIIRDVTTTISSDQDSLRLIVPAYVRAGAIIPFLPVEQYVGELISKNIECPITLEVYPGAVGSYTMYLDDGVSRSSAMPSAHFSSDPEALGMYRSVLITHRFEAPKVRLIDIIRTHDNYTPAVNYFFVRILHEPSESGDNSDCVTSLSLNGNGIRLIENSSVEEARTSLSKSSVDSYIYDSNLRCTLVKIHDISSKLFLLVNYV
ncbi:TIM-barrel domain-containing protein [Synechococcus lacustris]|uniref:TIM-barrel domain-containing protein n=1 Tax=Synechococcus lacustris TaxID=2116544 RepID=UPI0020CC447F|nr:TIM-barrel domain-containing protein [Synechococcus lacustris]